MTSASTRFTGTRKLNAVKTLAGHEPYFSDDPDGKRIEQPWGPGISYFPDGHKIISGYHKSARLWDLKAGEEMEKARVVCEQNVNRVAVSRDGRWVVIAQAGGGGELKACEVKTGVIKSFKAPWVAAMDISRDSKLLVSGSIDGTMRIWDLEIGDLMASTFTGPVYAVRFSQDSKKLAVMSGDNLEVWNIKARKLEIGIRKNYYTNIFEVPVFWTTNDRTIVAALSLDSRDPPYPKTIHEIDSSTLEVVGAPFQGHTEYIHSLELSFDGSLLISASYDNTVKLWAFESRHLLASFHGHDISNVALSPDACQLAYTTRKPGRRRIYISDIPPDILAELWPGQQALGSDIRQNGDPLNSDATARRSGAAQRILVPVPVAAQPLGHSGHSHPTHQQDFFVLHYFRKLLSRKGEIPAIAIELRDPLDCPATSPRLSSKSSSVPTTNFIDHHSGENSGHMLPISQSANRAPSSLHHLFNWRPARTGHAPPPIVDVPFTQGQKRNAAAGAPRCDDGGYIRDEEFDSRPTSPNSTSQRTPSGEHGVRRLCFCL